MQKWVTLRHDAYFQSLIKETGTITETKLCQVLTYCVRKLTKKIIKWNQELLIELDIDTVSFYSAINCVESGLPG